mmetsp:Transcript_17501/g.26978  ORF Transcript_17501/g.26978 Transcript_17501/m.26978 type:complete len:115 (+) Transcript_17501:504-848(+)
MKEMVDQEECKSQLYKLIQDIIYYKKDEDYDEDKIIPSKPDLSRLITAFHEKEVRMQVMDELKLICTPKCVVSLRGLQTLGELLKYLLTALIHEKDVNFKIIYAILNSSMYIYY